MKSLSEETAIFKKFCFVHFLHNIEKIQILRMVFGLSQKEFAEAIETTQASISRYEKDGRTPDAIFLSNVVEKFDVNPDWLLTTSTVLIFKNTKGAKNKK